MQSFEHSFSAMGGPCKIHIECQQERTALAALSAAEAEVRRLESKYSRYLSNSITSSINSSAGIAPVAIDEETAGLLNYADTVWQESAGLFDLTSGVLRHAWDFRSGLIPEARLIESLLAKVGWQRLQWTQSSAFLTEPGMELDFGGCVKEYAADSAASILRSNTIEHALVNLAGDLASVGGQGSGQPWTIGVRHPQSRNQAAASLELVDQALASSGDYERFIEFEGKRYGHILNPLTGWPVQGLAAVSVTGPQCLVAGSAATLAMLKPENEALKWLHTLGLPWVAVNYRGQAFSADGPGGSQFESE
ncbi:MAG: FAD:protein FMN transferase [Halioglobus sp.]